MLGNRLISIQKVSKFIFVLIWLVSCSTKKEIRVKTRKKHNQNEKCENKRSSSDLHFLTISAKHHSRILTHCFKTYMRFETNKKQTIKTCNVVTVRKNGQVKYAYTRGYKGTILPKDIKMCMKQGLLQMRFKGLQLKKGHTIKFPISFQSK